MSKADITKAFIVEKVAPIFNTKGYAGTSLNDMTAATGLTKGSIYGNFENKDEVALAVFEYSTRALSKRFAVAMEGKTTATDQLFALTGYYRTNWKAMFERGGCPILNASIEADDNLPFLKKNVQLSIKSWAARIAKVIEAGKHKGEFKKSVDATAHAYEIITIIEGGVMMAKISNNQHLLFAALDRIEKIIREEMRK